jgi:hypothetical protein
MDMKEYLRDKLNELPCDQAIFSDKIYRKINNADNTYSVYRLDFKNNGFVWEKIYNFMLPEGHECISFDNLVYHKGAMRLGLENSTDCITIYMCPTDGIATKEMIYKGDNLLIWNMFNQDIELDESLFTDSLLNLPTHVDLIQESQNYPEECQTDNYDSYELIDNFIDTFEPLHGWDNLLERSSDIEDNIPDNDLENNEDISENFNYPDDEDYSDNIKDNVTELDEVNEEYRIDPYDGELYSKNEFLEYYGGETEWNHQSPKNILLREEYYKFTTTFGQLSDKKFMYLLKKYEKTFSQ